MRNTYISFLYLLFIMVLGLLPETLWAMDDGIIHRLEFKQITALDGLPNDEVQKVYQDREGFMWFATRNGVCQYDGYKITTFKSDLYTPDLLTNNNVLCLMDDADHNLWIGALEGLNVLNKETGEIRKNPYKEINSNGAVSCLLVTRDNTVWVGTDGGLFRYDREADRMELYNRERTNDVLGAYAIKALCEDTDGDIWIGTWARGLYRYSPQTDTFYAYPSMNSRNSAHHVFEDSRKNIWVVGWGKGLFMLENPKDLERVSWKHYTNDAKDIYSLSDDFVYDVCEDPQTRTLWVGTRSGLSITELDDPGRFINYKTGKSPYYISCNEINSIERDASGKMWLGTVGGGVYMTDTRKPKFEKFQFQPVSEDIPTAAIRSLFVDSDGSAWLGIGTYGVARHHKETNEYTHYSRMPEFAGMPSMPTVYSIIKRKATGELWMGTYDGGLYTYKKGKPSRHYRMENSDFLPHVCVVSLYEDSKGHCWVGTRAGIGVKRNDGTGYLFNHISVEGQDFSTSYIRDIGEDARGNIWLLTSSNGVIRVSGDVLHPETLQFAEYSPANHKLPTKSTLAVRCDTQGRLWVGTEGHGLFLYNEQLDLFEGKNECFKLPGDRVGSIEEDERGNLWLGTNEGLLRLEVGEDNRSAKLQVYTAADGLQDKSFIPRSSYKKDGELFFGGYKGYNSFYPDSLTNENPESPFFITDIKIFNRSLHSLESSLRNRISPRTATFTDKIMLPYKYNNFNIEFASLTYKNPELNKYAYKLKGFEKEWVYTDATRHFAYYNNLTSGTYTFQLRATNENGIWNEQVRELSVVVLPPFWATWWAYLIYVMLVSIIVYYLYRTAANRMILRNSLELQKMEQRKAEELNHAKLQFFTNITHELLTPLTIISATVDELKIQAPQFTNLYPVINANIQRLIRLLQQILEFRKAESGNLKLRVSFGDIAIFVRNGAEAFQPLLKKRKLHFSIVCDPDSIHGYFDPDKLDKILYNLFSNAAKYSHEGGFIQVNLSYAESKDYVLITVKDNGKGISAEKQKNLFARFYEGDYRKFNTIGTGIGLSLTKDLVELHGGTIYVESEQNKGATFFVRIPIERPYFKEEEIDDDFIAVSKTVVESTNEVEEVNVSGETVKRHTLLVLEDNEELLQLLVTLLSREYNVLTAENGKEGVVIAENEDIDLIVSDIMMPEMDGIEFCKHIKSKLEFSHIPVILLTAKNKEEDRAGAYESGADGFISKPFNLAVLHARIKNLLKTKERMARDFKKQLVFEVKELNYTSLDEDFMQRAIECVNRHLDDPEFDQLQFVEEMNTSKSTLYKKLKSLTGLNTSSFIRNIRLKAAIKIMEEKKGVRVSELAYAVGFNDPKYFSSCFKKEFGMLPSEYMERYMPG